MIYNYLFKSFLNNSQNTAYLSYNIINIEKGINMDRIETQGLKQEIRYDIRTGNMKRFHRHIVNFSNEAILAYLKAGVDTEKTYMGDTPMQTAIACGNIEAVLLLIQNGTSLKKYDLEYAQEDTTKKALAFMFESMRIKV